MTYLTIIKLSKFCDPKFVKCSLKTKPEVGRIEE